MSDERAEKGFVKPEHSDITRSADSTLWAVEEGWNITVCDEWTVCFMLSALMTFDDFHNW